MVSSLSNITSIPDSMNRETSVHYNESEMTTLIAYYLDNLKTPSKSVHSGSLKDFFTLVSKSIEARQNTEGTASSKRILFTEEDPPRILDTPSITYCLKTRLPGRFDQGPSGPGKVKEVVAHQRSIIDHPDHVGEKLVTMGKFYDNWVEFSIYASTNKVALDNLLWFEKVMDSFNWVFRLHGFRVIEDEVGKREHLILGDKQLTKYPLTYMVRTEDTYHFGTQELKKIVFNLNAENK